jgi:predicted dehydrogenase
MNNRRDFIKLIGLGGLSLPVLANSPMDFNLPLVADKKLGIALVGLGNYAVNHILVGIEASPFWELRGLVTGTPSKIPALKSKFKIKDENIFTYDTFDKIANAKDIDVVYICLPNGLHAEYTIRAAKAGKHIICEKPMANTSEDAELMIKAAEKANVKLAIGYRCHFEPFNMEAMRMVKENILGDISYIHSDFGFKIGDPTQWRLKKKLSGGGPLMDVGIYCINAARYLKNVEPISIIANFGPVTNKEKFKEVEESVSWNMGYADGSTFTGFTSYNTNIEVLDVRASKGWLRMSPAFSYGPLAGETHLGKMTQPIVHVQTYQMNAMAELMSRKEALPSHISGAEGLRDMRIIDAIFKSAASEGKKVML